MRLSKIEYELRPDGRRPPWSVAQAMRDGKRQGFAYAPSGYGRKTSLEWYNGEAAAIGVRGPLATALFDDPPHPEYGHERAHALADVNLADWIARYGYGGLDGYPVGPGFRPPPRVPFFIPIEAVPPGRRVVTLKNGMRYVVPEGVGEVVGEVVARG